jgi:hypothetical protein
MKRQSRHGQRRARSVMPTNAKQPIAAHANGWRRWLLRIRPPRNEVVIAAAAISVPARDRSSATTRSCSSSARFASSYASAYPAGSAAGTEHASIGPRYESLRTVVPPPGRPGTSPCPAPLRTGLPVSERPGEGSPRGITCSFRCGVGVLSELCWDLGSVVEALDGAVDPDRGVPVVPLLADLGVELFLGLREG